MWRSQPLPSNWQAIRARIMERDEHRCAIVTNGVRCAYPATDVDHIDGAGDHSDANLRAICTWHHRKRTAQQANAARRRVSQRHPSEKHPGLL